MWWLWPVISLVVSAIAFFVAWRFYVYVKEIPVTVEALPRWGGLIRAGAFQFLKTEYRVLGRFTAVVAVLLFLFFPPIWNSPSLWTNLLTAAAYAAGAVLSGLAGVFGMSVATVANIKAASEATRGISGAYLAGFRGGATMGLAVVATGLSGAAVIYLLAPDNPTLVLAFSFGASTVALFAKAGGGIFTKTADIAADLTGKVELGIPEDDPRNPAVIADNVGDNVGDVAGMGADLFDSNVASLAAALILGVALGQASFVFCLSALGLAASVIGVLASGVGSVQHPGKALNKGTYLTTFLFFAFTLAVTILLDFQLRLWISAAVGLAAGVIIGVTSERFTASEGRVVRLVADASRTGPAFTILSGFSYGLLSTFPSLLGIGGAALAAYLITDPLGPGYALFGVALAAVGMLSVVAMITSNDAYGPIVDNARGLAEMGNLGDDVLEVTDRLDAAGNTAKAITKGFSIGAAGLTVIALLAAYQEILEQAGKPVNFEILNPLVFFGLLVGVSLPAIFSGMLILGVNRNASRLVTEIHRQFEEILGLKEGKPDVSPDYDRCIELATIGALRELLPAGIVAIVVTLAVGFVGGVQAIGGFLTGNILSGLLLALLMSNAGGMWDNAKKLIETGVHGGKGSPAHKASVIGDTVGDPFKDTAGPSLNTQITVVSLVSSLCATLFASFSLLG